MGVLEWRTAPRAEPPEKRAEWYGGGIPGAYAPSMDDDWRGRWKARLLGQRSGGLRVEVRKTTCIRRGSSVQVLVIACEDGTVRMSMNGTAELSALDFARMHVAVAEARQAMAAWRGAHPQEARDGTGGEGSS